MRRPNIASLKYTVKIDFQSLEARQMLSAVTVSGSNSAEEIRVYVASNTIIVDIDGDTQSFPDFLYDGIVINALGGADTIIVDSNTDNAVTVNGGNGVDSIEVGKSDQSLDGIESSVFVSNSSGADRVYIHSQADSGNATFTIENGSVSKTGYPLITTGDSGVVAVSAGGGTDTFVVNSTGSGNRYEFRGGAGADTFNVRNTHGADVILDGEADMDLVKLNEDLGTPALVQFEVTQDLSRIDSNPGSAAYARGTAGIYLSTNQSDCEGDILIDTGFMIEKNSAAANGLGYWRQRLLGATTSATPQLYSEFAAQSNQNDTIGYGYAENTAVTTLGGFPVVSADLVLRYTLRGDANLDGAVNFDDLLTLAQNYSTSITGRLWTQGDFNLSGLTDFDDLLALAQNYGQNAASVRTPTRGARAAKSSIDLIA